MATQQQQQLDFSIVSPRLTVEAMRDSGYKDTDHALAELIDNSVEANAELIEVIAVERPPEPDRPYSRASIERIAVSDDGVGMDSVTLRRALRFGDGTRLEGVRAGIGRFGIGLPNASISQCRRVDIWTWRNGPDNALHCYLSLDEVAEGQMEIPVPSPAVVPDEWRSVARSTDEPTGTLVVWSQLDRVRWRGGAKTLARTEELCGRVYRKFLSGDEGIELDFILAGQEGSELQERSRNLCRPNDPLYLTAPSSTPAPFDKVAMFRLYNERRWTIRLSDGRTGSVDVRCAMAKPDAINQKRSSIKWPRSFAKAGQAPWGKHADRNKGVSIVRAGRELEISQAWVNSYEPEERWWTVEVSFDPVLDEIFGVVNNKQHAHIFVEGSGFHYEEVADPNESYGDFLDRLEESEDPRFHLIEIWNWLNDQIVEMRNERRKIMRGSGPSAATRHPSTGETAEDVATNIINEQAQQGDRGDTDDSEPIDEAEKIVAITDSLTHGARVDEATAREWAEETVLNGRRVLMKEVTLGHRDAFFDVEDASDVIEVWLNDKHPVFEHFIEAITDDWEDHTLDELTQRLSRAAFALRLLLYAWARYEDKAPANLKSQIEDFRMDWGREARKFLEAVG